MKTTLVDIHPHIVSTDTKRYPVTPLQGKQSEWSKEHSVTLEEMIAAMDDAGVQKAAIVHSSTTYGFNNDYVADAVAQYPKRFTGVFSVNVMEPNAPQRMRELVAKGLTGMRIFARGSTIKEAWLALDDPATRPAWQCASDLGISVATNVHATGEAHGQIKRILEQYPMVRLIIDHLGRPPTEDGPPYAAASEYFSLAKYPNFYLKLTTTGVEHAMKGKATAETLVRKLVDVFGADHIAWGSNYPSAKGTMKEILARTRQYLSLLTDKEREWIFARTAQTLYPALAD